MATKITYLLGAGASANTIPVVADMHERIDEIVSTLISTKQLKDNIYNHSELPPNLRNDNQTLDEIIVDFRWLLKEVEHYSSIDTLAKKFYLIGNNNDYERLKKCLIIYLMLEQFCVIESSEKVGYNFKKSRTDKRYDSFIAALANREKGKLVLNSNIKVLSWNYDLQMELSLGRFTGRKIDETKKEYQIFPFLNAIPKDGEDITLPDKFSLRKLNGNAIFSTAKAGERNDDNKTLFDTEDDSITNTAFALGLIIEEVSKLDFTNNVACRYFNFSWENQNDFDNEFGGRKHIGYENNLIEAEKIASSTEILVVIGYSFPIFNRDIDNRLFRKMEKLKKVYIQDRDPERIMSTMKNAFEILQRKHQTGLNNDYEAIEEDAVRFHLDNNTNQFIIPYELNQ